ncbi:hypothetical protein LVY72_01005 [Arthrobacter sp. I2-34]|uniref:Uncharacterized protein n=1 Tax=Arthrobacter hankyongi TaxID=2904801 RepID=A0ABS9L1E0_9MICC|nr:hypothetical protein [Arthrobacter hankyongi]MCG2620486.1 hypothetical protein [Arthrobacter hankyongi]
MLPFETEDEFLTVSYIASDIADDGGEPDVGLVQGWWSRLSRSDLTAPAEGLASTEFCVIHPTDPQAVLEAMSEDYAIAMIAAIEAIGENGALRDEEVGRLIAFADIKVAPIAEGTGLELVLIEKILARFSAGIDTWAVIFNMDPALLAESEDDQWPETQQLTAPFPPSFTEVSTGSRGQTLVWNSRGRHRPPA